jgi:hypothetical protein
MPPKLKAPRRPKKNRWRRKSLLQRLQFSPAKALRHLTDIEPSAPRKAASETAAPKKTTVVKQQMPPKGAQASAAGDKIQNTLDVFAKGCVTNMNQQKKPGINQKEVKRQPDGTFMARWYLAVDPDSLQTSYNPTDGHKTITHIGRIDYHEVEYVCVDKNQK